MRSIPSTGSYGIHCNFNPRPTMGFCQGVVGFDWIGSRPDTVHVTPTLDSHAGSAQPEVSRYANRRARTEPDLSVIIGMAIILSGLGSRAWSLTLAATGILYGLFGALRLGATQ